MLVEFTRNRNHDKQGKGERGWVGWRSERTKEVACLVIISLVIARLGRIG